MRALSLLLLAASFHLAPAISAQDVPEPLADAVAGEWARYIVPEGREMVQTVTRVLGKRVSIKTEVFSNGTLIEASYPARADTKALG